MALAIACFQLTEVYEVVMELHEPSRIAQTGHCKEPNAHPCISLVVPCHNAASTLRTTVLSVRPADRTEILVVDDGSTDGSLTIARSFEPHVCVLSGPNRGVSTARNWGIAESTGEWLIFLDADDQLMPHTIEQRLAVAAEHPEADVLVCRWQELIVSGSGTSLFTQAQAFAHEVLLKSISY